MKNNLQAYLLAIDPQNDFMDQAGASLPVSGAVADMKRLAGVIARVGPRFFGVGVTLDSHNTIDVAHPSFWKNEDGNHPAPFTIISANDIRQGVWKPRHPTLRARMIAYAETLETGGKYPLMVWPEHCRIGTPGHNVQEDLREELAQWERRVGANVGYVAKGANPFTEHYGALLAEVPDPNDPSTGLNTELLDVLARADIVGLAGEALSHCVRATVQQIADNIGEAHIRKFHILTDCTSSVASVAGGPDFPAISRQWLKDMEARGMVLTTSDRFLA